jgi:hypothetical protein
MLTNDAQLRQAMEQLERLYRALAHLRQELCPTSEWDFALHAEGPVAMIEELRSSVEEYAGYEIVERQRDNPRAEFATAMDGAGVVTGEILPGHSVVGEAAPSTKRSASLPDAQQHACKPITYLQSFATMSVSTATRTTSRCHACSLVCGSSTRCQRRTTGRGAWWSTCLSTSSRRGAVWIVHAASRPGATSGSSARTASL